MEKVGAGTKDQKHFYYYFLSTNEQTPTMYCISCDGWMQWEGKRLVHSPCIHNDIFCVVTRFKQTVFLCPACYVYRISSSYWWRLDSCPLLKRICQNVPFA
jgi:hypothetical protein